MIRFENVTIHFSGEPRPLLENISFSLGDGKTLVIVGPSGHGKTVTLKLIAGLLKPTSGRIFIDDTDIVPLSGRQLAGVQKKMGMLFQKNALFDSLTCLENLSFPLSELTDLPPETIGRKAHDMLENVRLKNVDALYPDELSGGMQKRVGIARALVVDPGIILYDDPTAGLDPITSRHIVDLIIEMRGARKSTVVAVTNDMNRAYQMADMIAMVFQGSMMITGTPEETKAHTNPVVHQFVHGLVEGPMMNHD
jgi:phospholipid/cholesterol/gamma-HCH transport system ATP-binding protein